MQISGLLGVPLLLKLGIGGSLQDEAATLKLAYTYWMLFSFLLALIIIILLIRKQPPLSRMNQPSSIPVSIIWAFVGIILGLVSQAMAGYITQEVFGAEPGSENTEFLLELAKATPLFIVVTSILGPILEEIVFRKIIFGTLYQRFNFWIAALLSSAIFGIIHMDFVNILVYTATGLTFAYLYVKTKRILVPIFAHVSLNTFVVLVQLIFKDEIERYQQELETLQAFISLFH
ncbi:CPBP family intramembrane glutamic endopeptidase [Bacillus salitolerans]|uniref:CPBP family intramembrane glutamic endopeptidase n=1 Tax=Bacillus salitolerans TaxID=1437434 RepID=A0ABW4LVQ6_9BACI